MQAKVARRVRSGLTIVCCLSSYPTRTERLLDPLPLVLLRRAASAPALMPCRP
jgi:hypothetical protein